MILKAPTIETIPIEKYCVSQYISMGNLKLKVVELSENDYIIPKMLYKLEAKIAVSTLAGEVVSYPKSWWDYLKRDYAPKWFIKRFPVLFNHVKYDFKVSYPNFALDHAYLGRGYVSIYKQSNYEHNYIHST